MIGIYCLDTDEFQFGQEQKTSVQKMIRRGFKQCKELLPGLPDIMNLTVFPHRTFNVIEVDGSGGYAAARNWLPLFMNPWHEKGFDWVVSNSLKGTLYHELHHVAANYTYADGYDDFVKESLQLAVYEGMAVAFERDFSGREVLWGEYDPDTIGQWLQDYKAAYKKDDYNFVHWNFQHPDGRKWIKYRVGTYIVDQAIKNNPGQTAATLASIPPKEIIKMAGF